MSGKTQSGMTMIELVLAIVIISVGLAGVLTAFRTVVAGSADPLVYKQMLAIAEEMLEEVSLQPFAPVAPSTSNAPAPCTSRAAFNDILDYNNYETLGGVCNIDGEQVQALSAYDVAVRVAQGSLGGLSGTNVYQITVTVSHGNDAMSLVGWRTNYAAGLPD